MPDLLLELFSEEIPARMQRKAAGDLRSLVTNALVNAGLTYEGAKEYWTPRRLALDVRGLTPRSADISEERKGPRTDAPQQAIDGFLRGAGLSSIDEATVKSDPMKGDFYVAVINKPGREATEIIAEVMPAIIRDFPWPKSMRWGEKSREAGSLRWVRPLHSILCTFGPETEEPVVIPFEIAGIKSSNTTRGHRFLAPGEITVRRFEDYVASLEKARVILDAGRRKEMILSDAQNLAFAQGYELVEDAGLLEEVANLVEWPTVLMGRFDEAFLDIPPQVIQLTIRENQKCFVVRKQGESELANRFVLVSNIIPSDGGEEVTRGNGKVVAARLSDAKFFWESDLQQTVKAGGFEEWVKGLDEVTFHAKLGSQGDRVRRIMALAGELAPIVGADLEKAKRAALIAKADLQSAMVYEIPEMQGRIGRIYAEKAGEDASVALAIEEHYKPLGPTDDVPSDPVSVTVALADKLDTLVGFWAIDEKPTGSKDPFALRRAALGICRLCTNNALHRLQLEIVIMNHLDRFFPEVDTIAVTYDLIDFIFDRLKVQMRDLGISHDVIDAVARSGMTRPDNPMPGMSNVRVISLIVLRAIALQKLVETDDGENLIQGYRRAANILAAEEKKGATIAEAINPALFEGDEERALFETLEDVETLAANSIESENFDEAMSRLASLRAPIDNFFEHVHVNADDKAVRANRLALLSRIRAATATVADLSKISG